MGRGKGGRNRKAISLHLCPPVPASPGSHSLRALERPRGPSQLGELPGCRCPAEVAASGLSGRIQVDSGKGAAPTPGLVGRRGGVLRAANPGPPAHLLFQMRHLWGPRRRGNARKIVQGAETKQPTISPPSASASLFSPPPPPPRSAPSAPTQTASPSGRSLSQKGGYPSSCADFLGMLLLAAFVPVQQFHI